MISSFTLTSPVTQSSAPFSIGHVFKKGDVPAGSSVSSSTPLQVVPKNYWNDGSLRFAVVSGTANLTAGAPTTVTLEIGAAGVGTALSLADLKATSVVAVIDAGSFGSVSWANTDWDSPFAAWVSGPKMSSWIYRKQIGSDPHLVGWLEVRLYAGGAVEILPWIENGYLQLPSSSITQPPINKNSTYAFSLGGVQRCSITVDICARTRIPIINGTELSYWLGADPQVTPRHDTAYIQSTALVPCYSGIASSYTLQTSFVPKEQGGFTYSSDAMAGTGAQSPIGLLPKHDVLYFVTADQEAFASVVRNGYSAGRYPLCYRDETTNRPLKFSAHPNSSTNYSSSGQVPATNTGTAAPAWDIGHHPSMGYVAYLLTGAWYHMETTQFVATRAYLRQVDSERLQSQGIFLSNKGASTVRGAAWAHRSLLHATLATADSDALYTEFVSSLTSNINYCYSTYVAQSNNPFGFVAPYGDVYGTSSDGLVHEAAWQQDFFTAAYGYILASDPPIDTTTRTKLSQFFAWKAKSIIGRLGGESSTEWPWYDAAQYWIIAALVDVPDWIGGTGPWASDWGVLYQATRTELEAKGAPMATGSSTAMRGGNTTDPMGYWANLRPAIVYAVQHGVPGAQTAMDRLTGATNYSSVLDNMHPVWRTTTLTAQTGEQTVGTPCTLVDSASLRAGFTVVSQYRGLGIPAAAVATGFENPSLLENDIDVNDPADTQYRVETSFNPFSGGWIVNENSSWSLLGASDGIYTGTTQTYKNSVVSTSALQITIGAPALTEVTRSFDFVYSILKSVTASFTFVYNIQGQLTEVSIDASKVSLNRKVVFSGSTKTVRF